MVWLLTMAGFLVAVAAMAIGVIFTGRRLQGSCGGASGACLCKPGDEPAACPKKAAPEAVTTKAPASNRSLDILPE